MFYSQKEFYDAVAQNRITSLRSYCMDGGLLSRKKTNKVLKKIKKGILDREEEVTFGTGYSSFRLYLGKIYRPWNIVPALREFRAPEGDFGVGVEIEYGFVNNEAAKTVMYHVRNWKHVALDREGGYFGVETTFPPVLYSKISMRDKPFRYLQYLAANPRLLARHCGSVGTHINVSAHNRIDGDRVRDVNGHLECLSITDNKKYFNRNPYGYINNRSESQTSVGYVEMKLFNSTTCAVTLRRYINIAVSLVKLLTSDAEITEDSVLLALEEGYNMRSGHIKKS